MAEAVVAKQAAMSALLPFSRFLSEHVGLHFPAARLADLHQGVIALSCRLGQPDAETCMRWLMSMPLDQDKIEAIAAELTVGETYFFRESASLDAIEQQLLPELIRARQHQRRLRIWSAGCSTGEEAYTLAIMVDRMAALLQGWQVTILATDIHADALRRAAHAHYRDWSFRDPDSDLRSRYFQPTPDGQHALISRIRDRVQFQHLNLADAAYPSLLSHTSGMDLILCRNVLMYFEPEVASRVVDRLGQALAEHGCLVTGASESWMPRHRGLLPITIGTATVFRRPAVSDAVQLLQPTGARRPPRHAATAPDQAPPATPVETAPVLLARARAWADAGRLDEALHLCRQAVAANKLDAAAHYLHGLVLMEAGRPAQAEQALRTTVYLDTDFVMAHVALAGVMLARGRATETQRHVDIARGLLRSHGPHQLLPWAEGMSCAQVLRMLVGLQEQAHA